MVVVSLPIGNPTPQILMQFWPWACLHEDGAISPRPDLLKSQKQEAHKLHQRRPRSALLVLAPNFVLQKKRRDNNLGINRFIMTIRALGARTAK